MLYFPKRAWLCNLRYLYRTIMQLHGLVFRRKRKKKNQQRCLFDAQQCSQDTYTYIYVYNLNTALSVSCSHKSTLQKNYHQQKKQKINLSFTQ